MSLDFDCGAQIKLGFAAEFSNVLVIYTHIVKKPEDMFFCQAHVTNFSPVRRYSLSPCSIMQTCSFPKLLSPVSHNLFPVPYPLCPQI